MIRSKVLEAYGQITLNQEIEKAEEDGWELVPSSIQIHELTSRAGRAVCERVWTAVMTWEDEVEDEDDFED